MFFCLIVIEIGSDTLYCVIKLTTDFEKHYSVLYTQKQVPYVPLQGHYRLGGVVVERASRVREVVGFIPGRVIPNTLKIIVMTALLDAQVCGG